MIIITTVGTSIFENYLKEDGSLRDDYDNRLKDKKEKPITYKNWDDRNIKNKRDKLKTKTWNWAKGKDNASAEIASILSIAKQTKEGEEVKVHLIATDTVLSVLAAELIRDWFKESDFDITVDFQRPEKLEKQKDSKHIIHKLRVSSNKDFQEGFMNLIDVVSGLIDEGKKAKEEVILNITGGYKAIIPIMTLIGQIKEVPLKYIYEESSFEEKDGLVEIGNLPINFDWELGELYLDYLSKNGLQNLKTKTEIVSTLRILNLIQEERIALTPLGQLFSNHLRGLMDAKKGRLGYLVELKVYEYFIESKVNTTRGKAFWWDKTDTTKFSYRPMYNKDAHLESKLDIDILLKRADNEEDWNEVKSFSDTGLTKAKKQIKTMLKFIESTSYSKVKSIGLILYKLESTNTTIYNKKIEDIENLFSGKSINFKVSYINIPINKKGTFNVKRFFEQEIELKLL